MWRLHNSGSQRKFKEGCLNFAHDNHFSMPAGISALTALTRLSMTVSSDPQDVALSLASLYSLTSLQHLFVYCDYASLSLSAGFSSLKCPQRLYLGTAFLANSYTADEMRLGLYVDWSTMHALQHLKIQNWRFTHIGDLSGLTTLPNLSFVRLDNCAPSKHIHNSHLISRGLVIPSIAF